jgi:hypothetical protein
MTLPPAEFDSRTHRRFNAGVFYAFTEDDLAVYRVFVQHGARPEVVIVGVHDEPLSDNRPMDAELESNYEFRSQIDGSIASTVEFIRNRFETYSSKALNIITVFDLCLSAKLFVRPLPAAYSLAADGRANRVALEQPANDLVETQRQLLRKMEQRSPRRTALLEVLIRDGLSRHVKFMLFATPYRPDAIAAFRNDGIAWKHHLMAVRYLRSLGDKYGIGVRDYSEQESFGGVSEDWLDCLHYGSLNASRLARKIVQDGY